MRRLALVAVIGVIVVVGALALAGTLPMGGDAAEDQPRSGQGSGFNGMSLMGAP